MKAYTFVKNVTGSLRITLDSYDMSLSQKDFFMAHGMERVVVPHKYALGLFISDGAKNQFDLGYFTIDDYESLKEEAIGIGLAAGVAREVNTPKAIAEALESQDLKFIDKLLDKNNPVDIANLINIIRANLGKVPYSILERVENACGVELKVDGEKIE